MTEKNNLALTNNLNLKNYHKILLKFLKFFRLASLAEKRGHLSILVDSFRKVLPWPQLDWILDWMLLLLVRLLLLLLLLLPLLLCHR